MTATTLTDPLGDLRYTTYDAAGYPLTITKAYGTPLAQTITFVRGPDEKPTSVTDALGRVTTATYDNVGNLLNRTYLSGTTGAATYSYTYTSDYNQIASLTDPLGHTTTLGYTSGCLTSITDVLNRTSSIVCTQYGQVFSVTDPLSRTTSFTYNNGVLESVKDPLNRTVGFGVDNVGRRTAIADPQGNSVAITYDAMNRATSIVDSSNRTTQLQYSNNGKLVSLTDPNNGITQLGYDTRNRRISRTDALNRSESWTYDGVSHIKSYTDRKAQLTQYNYDALKRLSLASIADGSTIQSTYDAGNRLTQLADSASGTITLTVDGRNRVTQVQSAQGALNYQYDKANRRTQMTAASQTPVNYAYDDANRLTSITQSSEVVQFAYDDGNRRTQLTLPNGVTTTYAYDLANQLTAMIYQSGSGTQLASFGYTYDASGRITAKIGGFQTDPLPTATTATSTFDSNNRQTTFNGSTLSYDVNGNLTGDGTNTYIWDARNRLVQINRGASTIASFTYDAFGRRSSKSIGGATTTFLYDGANVVQEMQGSTVTTLLTGRGIDERYARDEAGGRRYFLTDALGSTVALTDASALVQQTYGYEPYGEVASTGTSGNPYQYTGRENDGIGLYYYRARYYSPNLKRFISSDPIGLRGGLNSYAYVSGNPLRFSDPTGLTQADVDHAIAVINSWLPPSLQLDPDSVRLGDLAPGKAGETNFFGNITLSCQEFGGDLDDNQKIFLLGALIHEDFHAEDGPVARAFTSLQDSISTFLGMDDGTGMGSHHNSLDKNATEMAETLRSEMLNSQ